MGESTYLETTSYLNLLGDAEYVVFGPVGREIFGAGTIIFAICDTVRTIS